MSSPNSPNAIKRILLTPGEPAGIGPDVTLLAALQDWPFEMVAVANPDVMQSRTNALGLEIKLIEANLAEQPVAHQAGTLKVIPCEVTSNVIPGELNTGNARYVIDTLETATQLCLDKKADALVTGPVHKQLLNDAGIPFSGHTEFLAARCNVPHTVMLFVLDEMKVALATTHVPLAEVAKTLTSERLASTIRILHAGLKQHFGMADPRLSICGLNPHAGEGGHLGREEIDTITPVIQSLQASFKLDGPLPADTIFIPDNLKRADAVLAMYHDQALPLVKYLGFDRAVNVTLGLPFLRTSVDHGTALGFAGTGRANPGSLIAALRLAGK